MLIFFNKVVCFWFLIDFGFLFIDLGCMLQITPFCFEYKYVDNPELKLVFFCRESECKFMFFLCHKLIWGSGLVFLFGFLSLFDIDPSVLLFGSKFKQKVRNKMMKGTGGKGCE